MSEDRSIDDFAADDETPVEPATATAIWSADGAACDRCDTVVKRRWLADGDRVCTDCKEW
ncbi:hypothetical protein SAMN05192561_10930 [Halopenitus malekzadehii]|uniref:DUF7573 domain-containing protein n=1 Tax=Halopenitus malekzadehii TaxID=1267564 RepID=A0A1H6JGD9_9EURY|nr:hypothetical protein [Halopenitus malekzadehii]SEH58194.1 hypothetical protein SAMN05192561_10930 [Halopenitus malekzadehii]